MSTTTTPPRMPLRNGHAVRRHLFYPSMHKLPGGQFVLPVDGRIVIAFDLTEAVKLVKRFPHRPKHALATEAVA